MFKGLNGFGRLMNIFMCAAMCVVLCIIIPFVVEANLGVQGALNPASFLQSFVLSFCIAYPFGDLLPAVNWGGKLAASLHVKGVGAYLIQCLVTALVLITCIAFVVSFVNNFLVSGMEGTIGFFLMIYPAALIGGFVAIVVFLGLFMKLATRLSGFDPAAAMAAQPSEV